MKDIPTKAVIYPCMDFLVVEKLFSVFPKRSSNDDSNLDEEIFLTRK